MSTDLGFRRQPNNLGIRLPMRSIKEDDIDEPSSHQSSFDGARVSDGALPSSAENEEEKNNNNNNPIKGGGDEEESSTPPPPETPCHTPRTPKNMMIPEIDGCPAAPKKSRKQAPPSCKRKLQFFEITARDEVESFFRMVDAAVSSKAAPPPPACSSKRRCLV